MTNIKDIRKKNESDLVKMLGEKREELRKFRFGEAGSRTRDVRAGRGVRRTIARILTELNVREVAESDKNE